METKKITRLSDSKDTKEGYAQISPDGKQILYVSDKNGINNIYLREADSSGNIIDRPITNSLNPIDQISMSRDGKKLLFVSLYKGGYDIFSLDNPLDIDLGIAELELTEFAKKMKDYANKFGREIESEYDENEVVLNKDSLMKKDSSGLGVNDSTDLSNDHLSGSSENDSTLSVASDSLKSLSEYSQNDDNNNEQKKKDSLALYGDDVKISFSKPTMSNNPSGNRDSSYMENINFKVHDNINSDGSFKIKKYKIKFTPDLVYGNANYTSFYGVQGVAQVALSDMLGDHRIYISTSLVIDLKNSDYAIAYYYLPKRIDYGITLYHTARFVNYGNGYYENLYRYRTFGANLSASYPISRFKRFEGSLAVENITRENLDNTLEPVESKPLAIPSFSIIHDNTQYGYTSPVAGTRYNLTLLGSPKFGENGIGFGSVVY